MQHQKQQRSNNTISFCNLLLENHKILSRVHIPSSKEISILDDSLFLVVCTLNRNMLTQSEPHKQIFIMNDNFSWIKMVKVKPTHGSLDSSGLY